MGVAAWSPDFAALWSDDLKMKTVDKKLLFELHTGVYMLEPIEKKIFCILVDFQKVYSVGIRGKLNYKWN